ncbi:MAG TPA: hypothetical protein VG871_18285 [Vicinamibacterales bacterium]|nr:hypothetical protein [Vicinamibacterales bacterium]
MSRIVFEPDLPVAPLDLGRTDVACFIGLVRLRRSLVPDSAHKVTGTATADVKLADVKKDDLVRVLAGEIVPVDGTVVDGWSLVDVTPGSTTDPLRKKGIDTTDQTAAQDPDRLTVTAGTLNVSNTITVRAAKDAGPVAPLPDAKRDWLRDNGWIDGPQARNCDALFDVPIPLDNFAAFQALYDDGTSSQAVGTDYLALAVQSFFAQGGKRCYVVRTGDPVGDDTDRAAARAFLLGTDPVTNIDGSEGDQSSWHGLAHLWGLPDVSFLLLPDLPLLHAPTIAVAQGETESLSSGPERFVPCVPAAATTEKRTYPLPAPRFDAGAYRAWSGTLRAVIGRLSAGRLREVQFVAAMPLPFEEPFSPALEGPPADALAANVHDAVAAVLPEVDAASGQSASSAFLQLAYPWLRSTRSNVVLEGLEAPDGTLAGVLARNALLRGTFTSATKIPPADLVDLVPALPTYETLVPDVAPVWRNGVAKPLVVRLSLFGFTPSGIRLLSDVTTYPGESYRPAPINRLVSVVSRMARHFGETHLFESNGPALWSALERTVRDLMTRLWSLGAFDGATPAAAFDVRCDRTTMTQSDIDNGRMVAIVDFQAAAAIELITVTLTVQTGSATSAELQAQLLGAA